MKTLITPVGSYLTGDAIADAVLEYWLALVQEGRADVIDVPILSVDGEPTSVTLTVGWMTPLAAVDTLYRPELLDGQAVESMGNLRDSLARGGEGLLAPDDLPEASPGGWTCSRTARDDRVDPLAHGRPGPALGPLRGRPPRCTIAIRAPGPSA